MAEIDIFAGGQFAGMQDVLEGDAFLVSGQNFVTKTIRAKFNVRQAGAFHELHQFRRQALGAQKTAPGKVNMASEHGLANFRHVPRRGIEDRIHNKDVAGAQRLKLVNLVCHELGRGTTIIADQ